MADAKESNVNASQHPDDGVREAPNESWTYIERVQEGEKSVEIEGVPDQGDGTNEDLPWNLKRTLSLISMAFLWIGSQIPTYLLGSIPPLIYSDIGGLIPGLGIAGYAIVQHLLTLPEWTHIITLSWSQQLQPHDKIIHSTIDLQARAQPMSDTLKKLPVAVDYVFCAYLAHIHPAETPTINVAMLQNFLHALGSSGVVKTLKRVILDAARCYWVVTHPQDIIGVAKNNFMNVVIALGLYATVSAALPGHEMPFPGAKTACLGFNAWTSASLHNRFCVWAALTPEAGNHMFNVVNGNTESWQNLWPKVAR
ncbi:hypothetical protein CLAIMM_14314 [Cladophialophora immunda]|nr:hypothetical protein CLAIMM_14314 [Cladophialophora immunda]